MFTLLFGGNSNFYIKTLMNVRAKKYEGNLFEHEMVVTPRVRNAERKLPGNFSPEQELRFPDCNNKTFLFILY